MQTQFREIDDINKKLKNDNLFYIHRNNNTIVEGLERKRLLNPIILIITLIILFYLCWKKETKDSCVSSEGTGMVPKNIKR